MPSEQSPNAGDIVVAKVSDGHQLLALESSSGEASLVYRGTGWSVQYAVARGAKLISRRGGRLWYSPDLTSLELLETFKADPARWREVAVGTRNTSSADVRSLNDDDV